MKYTFTNNKIAELRKEKGLIATPIHQRAGDKSSEFIPLGTRIEPTEYYRMLETC